MRKIGIEIECPFSFYYPDLFAKYFKSGKKFHEYSSYQLIGLNQSLAEREPSLLNKLSLISSKNGLSRGQDRYWQFVFPPQQNLLTNLPIIDNLIDENLLPLETPLSVHFTISEIDRDTAYAILLFLELKYLSKQRVLEGFSNQHFMPAWGKKRCKTGILKKDGYKLIGASLAYELRTLKIRMSDIENVFNDLHKFLQDAIIVDKARAMCAQLGLEWKPWNKQDFLKFAEVLK